MKKYLLILLTMFTLFYCSEKKEIKNIHHTIKDKKNIIYYSDFDIFNKKGINKINKSKKCIAVNNDYQDILILNNSDTVLNISRLDNNKSYIGYLNLKIAIALSFEKNIVKEIYYDRHTKYIYMYAVIVNEGNNEFYITYHNDFINPFFICENSPNFSNMMNYSRHKRSLYYNLINDYFEEREIDLIKNSEVENEGIKMSDIGLKYSAKDSYFWSIYMAHRERIKGAYFYKISPSCPCCP